MESTSRKCRLWISYDGTGLGGWQRQLGRETVQEWLERALERVGAGRTCVHGAGRTDAGVHALAQAAHVVLEQGPPTDRLHFALNTVLPPSIRVLFAEDMPKDFHARFSAKGKLYLYRIASQDVLLPPLRAYFHWERRPLDLEAMREAASYIVGKKDFAAFATNPGIPRLRSTVRTIRSLHLLRNRFGLDLYVSGDGFLYNQVRTLAGTLVDVGRGKTPPGRVREILASKDRKQAGPTLPPQGLFLVKVDYGDQYPPSRSLRRNHHSFAGSNVPGRKV